MELLKNYESPSCSDEEVNSLGRREVRQVYLITYSQASTVKFPTRRSFAEAVVRSFSTGKSFVVQWCCAKESHRNSGFHYHVSLKLDKIQRWLPAKRYMMQTYGVSVHFSNAQANYYTAWRYVTKQDRHYEQSDSHPDLSDSAEPVTMRAHEALRVRRMSRKEGESVDPNDMVDSGHPSTSSGVQTGTGKRKRLSSFEISQIIISKKIRDRSALLAHANRQKTEGKTNVAEFIVNQGTKVVNELIKSAWELENAEALERRKEKTRIEILQEACDERCCCSPEGEWELCALEVLHSNDIPPQQFANSVKDLLKNGRGKYRNVMLTGPTNCAKTFLLDPLNKIYRTFTNPSNASYAWLGAEESEVIFLNDFRWCPEIIAWHALLLLLEGQIVHLPAPKTHYAEDIKFDKDTPIFCTTKQPIVLVRNGYVEQVETEMMNVRWKVFTFRHQFSEQEQKRMQPCSSCFVRLILMHYED